ncbi:hypothetical protein [Streptomyces sp. NPDC018031]|uniref:hypothetical protein n=1 Tax=Streptomyces sp. NPDC018031 TaxID=3365033 RepID=UPI0037ADF050
MRAPREQLLFGAIYGSVLASTLTAALSESTGPDDPGYDALWVLIAALGAAFSHGYAHVIARRTTTPGAPGASAALPQILAQWPLVAASSPTVALLLGSYAGWYTETVAVYVALGFNTAALLGWGLAASRVAGRTWPASLRTGCVDMLIGLFIIAANVLSK